MVNIPYKGGAPAVASVVAGDTQVTFATPPSVITMIKAGRLRALAVTSRDRSPLMPEIPGMAEVGLPEYSISFWYGFSYPWERRRRSSRSCLTPPLSPWANPRSRKCWRGKGPR